MDALTRLTTATISPTKKAISSGTVYQIWRAKIPVNPQKMTSVK